jgi:lipopolysaccharide/colanic/teichoic acid biosynthesis glycosyltransferase
LDGAPLNSNLLKSSSGGSQMKEKKNVTPPHLAYDLCKRIFDFCVAAVSLLLLSPLMAAVALAVKFSSHGPLLYRGVRVGRGDRPFHMCKFRTMVVDAERLGGSATAEDDPRITPVGRWLRLYKLDELPQLLNVLRGEMSLVGPRPEVSKYVNMLAADERIILDVLPGITDWASIWNSNEAAVLEGSPDPEKSYEELIRPNKIALQLVYVRQRSLAVDIRILFHTAVKLFHSGWMPVEVAPYGRVRPYKLTAQVLPVDGESPNDCIPVSGSDIS